MVRDHEPIDGNLAWPERWPVLGPVAGFGVAMSFAAVAVAEADWMATTVFAAIAALLGAVAMRNERVTRQYRPVHRGSDSGESSPPGR